MGLFFNMDDSANTIFNEINSSYYSKSASYKAAASSGPQKTVVWLSRATAAFYGANAFEVSFAPYKVQYTQDAGGNVTSQAALGNMTNVLLSPFSNSTLWFTWNAADVGLTGGFKTEAEAIKAFHSLLETVGSLSYDVVLKLNMHSRGLSSRLFTISLVTLPVMLLTVAARHLSVWLQALRLCCCTMGMQCVSKAMF